MKPIERLLHAALEPFRLHPLVAPYLGCSKTEPPPHHFLHQYELSAMLTPRFPVRAFIGDEIGLGKTISAIAIAKCLWMQGRVKRVLVIAPRVLLFQWRKELERMGVSKVHGLERGDIPLLRARGFPEGFYLVSMDLIKREMHVERVEDAPWDLIIVDEAHKFGYKTERFKRVGGRLLEADPMRNVLLLSATPHRGNVLDYLSRLGLVDPHLIVDRRLDSASFYGLTHGAIMFRRTKEDVNNVYEGREVFPPATFYACLVKASEEEAEFVDRTVAFLQSKLAEFAFERGSLEAKALPLLRILVFKRASSSPYALMTTVNRMLAKRATGNPEAARGVLDAVRSFLGAGFEDYSLETEPDELVNEFLEQASPLLSEQDAVELSGLLQHARRIVESGRDAKLTALLSLLESTVAEGLKAVVFTEYKDTLEYVRSFIQKAKPEWRLNCLSSDETRNPEVFAGIREDFERNPEAQILLATDVVAEGVNMQVANIVVNYEVPWSIVKLEQRIGRVWRLGQTRKVEAYTFFVDNKADRAALKRMYEKLLSLSTAKLKPRAITGEELLLYADAKEASGFPSSIPPGVTRHRRGVKVSEYRLIKAFLDEGEAGLDAIAATILEAKARLMRELASKGVLYAPKTRGDVERTLSAFGFKDQSELMRSFKGLLKAAAPYLGIRLQERGGELTASVGGGMPFQVRTLDEILSLLLCKEDQLEPGVLVALGDGEEHFAIAEAKVMVKGALIHSEPVAVSLEKGTIYRGAALLRKVSEITSNLMGCAEGAQPDIPLNLRASIVNELKRAVREAYSPLEAYRSRLERGGFRNADSWASLADVEVKVDLKAAVKVVPKVPEGRKEPPEEVKLDVERMAMEYVMNHERQHGRVPIDVSEAEHYDVKSINPATGEVRYIEVKGHAGPIAGAELTDPEAEFARKMGRDHWLYIVYNVASKPEMLVFRDPMNSLAWRVVEKVDRRWVWP